MRRTALVRPTSTSHTFEADELDLVAHLRVLLALADELGARLRTTGEICRGLTLTVRYADRSHTTRSRTLPEPTHGTPALSTLAYDLYTRLGLERVRVRQLSLRADQLGPADGAHYQLLFDDHDDKARELEAAEELIVRAGSPRPLRPYARRPPARGPRHGPTRTRSRAVRPMRQGARQASGAFRP
ncbi:hypothetical protein [Streptomyces sp. NPDC056949]|uniref:DinB/UmuC family translesion DNA polymerase n=1 Tax=Streptomyces sp. NPDC056949 TaxID=3345976 RepID=UPI00363FBDFD